MNPDFYKQDDKDKKQNLFGSQGSNNVFQKQQPDSQQSNIGFGVQQTAFNTPFGTTSFGTQRIPDKQASTGIFGAQSGTPPATSVFGNPTATQTGMFASPSFGNQNFTQTSGEPFKSHSQMPSFGSNFGAQPMQVSNPFTGQPQTGVFGAQQPSVPASTQTSNPFAAASVQNAAVKVGSENIQPGMFGAQTKATQPQSSNPFDSARGEPKTMFGAPGVSVGGESQNFYSTSKPETSSIDAFPRTVPSNTDLKGEQSIPNDLQSSETRLKQSTSLFNQPGEKNISFLQMTLNEIIQQQTRRLEENIRIFKQKAKEVFDQDERIIRSLNNYKLIRNKIDEEERIIAETEENVEFFEKWLSNFQSEVSEGGRDELLTCIREFERVADRYNKAIENLKDEEDEVMCLVNENYNLINIIDEKLDILEKY